MPKLVRSNLPTKYTQNGTVRMARQLMFPPGRPYSHLQAINREYVRSIEAEVSQRRQIGPFEIACIVRCKASHGILSLVLHAIRTDERLRTPSGELDMIFEGTHRLLDRGERALRELTAALRDLGLDKNAEEAGDSWGAIHLSDLDSRQRASILAGRARARTMLAELDAGMVDDQPSYRERLGDP